MLFFWGGDSIALLLGFFLFLSDLYFVLIFNEFVVLDFRFYIYRAGRVVEKGCFGRFIWFWLMLEMNYDAWYGF